MKDREIINRIYPKKPNHMIWLGKRSQIRVIRVGGAKKVISVRRWIIERVAEFELPDGYTYYSTCGVIDCIAPTHIGIRIPNHCWNGHRYTEENTIRINNKKGYNVRYCKICRYSGNKEFRIQNRKGNLPSIPKNPYNINRVNDLYSEYMDSVGKNMRPIYKDIERRSRGKHRKSTFKL